MLALLALAAPLVPGPSGRFRTVVAAEDPPPENRELPPLTSEDLTLRAGQLFDAIVHGEPETADAFFFPREPFIPLKDVKDPGRYHDGLVRAYHQDVRALHAQRKAWEKARFVSFELGSRPRWVRPGEEWNKIGYFRTFNGKLRYEADGRTRAIDVHTIISWQGKWYVTHLTAVRK